MAGTFRPGRAVAAFVAAALAFAGPAGAQTPPAVTLTQPGSPPAAAPPPVATVQRPTLVPGSGDPSNADEVVLPERPVLVMSGTSKWEGGLKTLRAAFASVEAELAKLGVQPNGRPLAVFVETSDDDFRFDAMVPVSAKPDGTPALPAGMRWGTTPAGKAWRFVHKGPYDDIDSTYETITVYLDAKNVVAKDAFIEEYPNDVADPADPNLEINIFVQPR